MMEDLMNEAFEDEVCSHFADKHDTILRKRKLALTPGNYVMVMRQMLDRLNADPNYP